MSLADKIDAFLADRNSSATLRTLRGITPLSPSRCSVGGRECLNFSSNDYLGLSRHPRLLEEGVRWAERLGNSSPASRLVCATCPEYLELEERIAHWKGAEKALIAGSGYLANCGAIPALAGRKSAIFADRLNHASLNAGCMQSGAEFRRYAHGDYDNLESLLRNSLNSERLIVSDTVFSMDGDRADIGRLYGLSRKYDAFLYLDDAHSTGVEGRAGEGTSLDFADDKSSVVVMGTFSKAMGSYGAYMASTGKIVEYLVNACPSFIYSTALPPFVYGTISAGVEIVRTDEFREIRKRLSLKADALRNSLKSLGFDCGNSSTQIIPVMLGETSAVMDASRKLLEHGILAVAIRPPTVPEGAARLRISLNAAHTDDDVAQLLASMVFRPCSARRA